MDWYKNSWNLTLLTNVMIFNNTLKNTKLILLLDIFFMLMVIIQHSENAPVKQTLCPSPWASSVAYLKKAFIYVVSLSVASNQVLAPQVEFTTQNYINRFPSQLMKKVTHLIVELTSGNEMEEHFNQQERETELVLFLVLGIKTIPMGVSICKGGIQSPQVLLEDTRLKQAFAHNWLHQLLLQHISENWRMTEEGHGSDHLLYSNLVLEHCWGTAKFSASESLNPHWRTAAGGTRLDNVF